MENSPKGTLNTLFASYGTKLLLGPWQSEAPSKASTLPFQKTTTTKQQQQQQPKTTNYSSNNNAGHVSGCLANGHPVL